MTKSYTFSALGETDIPKLARLHREAFPDFFLSNLGVPFLVQFYRGFLKDPTAVTVIARDETHQIQGVAIGTLDPSRFFRRLLINQWPGFAAASLRAVILSPAAAPRLLRAVRHRGVAGGSETGAELSSICVNPKSQGTGVGRQLLEEWARQVCNRGVHLATLATDADNNVQVNNFYNANGWLVSGQFTTVEGRVMQRYSRVMSPQ